MVYVQNQVEEVRFVIDPRPGGAPSHLRPGGGRERGQNNHPLLTQKVRGIERRRKKRSLLSLNAFENTLIISLRSIFRSQQVRKGHFLAFSEFPEIVLTL